MVKSRAVALSADEVAQVVQNGEHDGRRDLSSLLSKSSDQAKVFYPRFYRERPMFNLKINDEDGKRAVARSKTSGLAAKAAQAAVGGGAAAGTRCAH